MGRIMKYIGRFEPGTCNTIDDATGFKVKLSEVRERWDGFMVTDDNFENRQPQDFPVTPRPPKVYEKARFDQGITTSDEIPVETRFFYPLDGATNVISLPGLAPISLPGVNPWYVAWGLLNASGSGGCVYSQQSDANGYEIQVTIDSNGDLRLGLNNGTYAVSTVQDFRIAGVYQVEFDGANWNIIYNGLPVDSIVAATGTAPAGIIRTVIGGISNVDGAGPPGPYRDYFDGVLYNVDVNASNFYAVNDNSDVIADSLSTKDGTLVNEVPGNWFEQQVARWQRVAIQALHQTLKK